MGATQKNNATADQSDDWVLDVDLFDRLMARKGVTTVEAQAELAGVHRATMFRWRKPSGTSIGVADAFNLAELAGTTVQKLFRRRNQPRPGPSHPPSGPANPPRREDATR